MCTDPQRLERLTRSLQLALDHEWPLLAATKGRLARLSPKIILRDRHSKLAAIATVATDGGENRLNLDPISLQILRVADSRGEIHFEDFIAQSLTPDEILRFFFQCDPRLQRFLDSLRVGFADLLPRSDYQRSHLLSMLRELMEWAALLKLASTPPVKLLIRDGLLRSVLLPERVFHALRERLESLTTTHGHLLAGVAKRSRVINYLSVALSLSETFGDRQPSYVAVPAEMEREAAPAQYRWISSRTMGLLHVARLDGGADVPLVPVDIAEWQASRVEEAMTILHESAMGSFPIRGYPQALTDAHEHARLGGLEIELLEQMFLENIASRDPVAARVAREFRLLGGRMSKELANDE